MFVYTIAQVNCLGNRVNSANLINLPTQWYCILVPICIISNSISRYDSGNCFRYIILCKKKLIKNQSILLVRNKKKIDLLIV